MSNNFHIHNLRNKFSFNAKGPQVSSQVEKITNARHTNSTKSAAIKMANKNAVTTLNNSSDNHKIAITMQINFQLYGFCICIHFN